MYINVKCHCKKIKLKDVRKHAFLPFLYSDVATVMTDINFIQPDLKINNLINTDWSVQVQQLFLD